MEDGRQEGGKEGEQDNRITGGKRTGKQEIRRTGEQGNRGAGEK